MVDRKWRIIQKYSREKFYESVKKYEDEGYELIPESFNVTDASTHGKAFYCLMRIK